MSQTNAMTEESFEKYYARMDEKRGFGWLYLGFASLFAMGLLAGAILDWGAEGSADRLLPGGNGLYVTFMGIEMELKALEYAGIFIALAVALISYAMASK